jgi:ABC-2 type transport system permease protein
LPSGAIVFAAAAFGLMVAALVHSRDSVLPAGAIAIMTMAAVGGCWWPQELEPPLMKTLALCLPTTWAMNSYNDLMIRHFLASSAILPFAVIIGSGSCTSPSLSRCRRADSDSQSAAQ